MRRDLELAASRVRVTLFFSQTRSTFDESSMRTRLECGSMGSAALRIRSAHARAVGSPTRRQHGMSTTRPGTTQVAEPPKECSPAQVLGLVSPAIGRMSSAVNISF